MKRAVIFDLDGTLVNSVPFHLRIHQKVFKKYGINLTKEYFEKECNGTEPHEFYEKILKHFLGSTKKLDDAWKEQKKFHMYSGLDPIKIFPGVKSTLKNLSKNGYRSCVASSSHTNYVKKILKNNAITEYFDHIIGSEHFAHSKPNPAIFLEAWREMGIKKKECVIIEDSVNGCIAAKRAGIDVICLLTSEKREDIPDYATIALKHSLLFDLIEKM
ncbi:MAG: HAD family hydrolase [Nanoarchaeota archaeon]